MDKETLIKWVSNNVKSVLKTDYNKIENFFRKVQDSNADYIIFISRRCYILYQIYALIMGWSKENILSDRGLWSHRSQLRKARSVAVADDMILHGKAMSKVFTRIRKYVPSSCSIKLYVYCVYNNTMDMVRENGIETFSVRTSQDCKKLTEKLVRCILINGMPYTTFTYIWYGTIREKIYGPATENSRSVIRFKKDVCEDSFKWATYFDFEISEIINPLIEAVCDGACLRYYKHENMQTVIPFVFIKKIKSQYIEKYYDIMQECFREIGRELIADEFEVVREDGSGRQEGVVYLASLLECWITRIIGVVQHVDDMFDVNFYSLVTKRNMEGTFSAPILQEISSADWETSVKFINLISNRVDEFKVCTCEALDDIFVHSNMKYKAIVAEYVKEIDKSDIACMADICRDIVINILEDMRLQYDLHEEDACRYIECNEIINLLKGYFDLPMIFAAQIDTWDQGMAAYEFDYAEESGICGRIGIGERSALIFAMKYGRIIRKYFAWQTLAWGYEGSLTQERKIHYLSELLEAEEQLSDYDKDFFRNTVRNGTECLYDYYMSC
ncbi:MAG: hypothetical protein HDR88_17305 [Bacteroides sp.]|nr:hypothetical protein [Bacteroides sp.]